MEKPIYELKVFGHKMHLLIKREADRRGFDFMAGPQGQVLNLIGMREDQGQDTLIKDIEQHLGVAKSVASNLVKRMEANDLIYLEPNAKDKRAKFVRMTAKSRAQVNQVQDFFDTLDRQILKGISEEELQTFTSLMKRFTKNLEEIGEENDSNV